MIFALRITLGGTLAATCLYGLSIFGPSFWPTLMLLLSGVLIASAFVSQLEDLGSAIARFVGVIALVAFGLLMLAGTTGGSFRLSDSNEIIAFALLVIAALGCAFFAVSTESDAPHSPVTHDQA